MTKLHLLARVARASASTVLTHHARSNFPALSRSVITLTHRATTTSGHSTALRAPKTFITSGSPSVTLTRAFCSPSSDSGAESAETNKPYDWIDDVSIQSTQPH